MSPRRINRTSAGLLAGLALGVAGGYVASASASSSAAKPAKSAHAASGARGLGAAKLRRAVSVTAIVPDGGGRFATVTLQRGTVVSTTSSSITLREGTPRATYGEVTVTVPAGSRVRLSGKPASLSQLSAGDRVVLFRGAHRTVVAAHPAATGATQG